MEPIFLLILPGFIIGAIVGSFLNVVIFRMLQEGSSSVFPASYCPVCREPLSWYENIPLLSYLFLRGRCGHCRAGISLQYPAVECCMGLFGAAIAYRFGLTAAGLGYFVFCAALLLIIWIDIRYQIIPDRISLPGIALGFLFSFINPYVTWQNSLLGLLAGGGIFSAIALLYALVRKNQGMGGGDIKLLAMIGAFLGWQSLFFVIFFSSLTGALVSIAVIFKQGKDGKMRIPFGPFLAVPAMLFLFFSPVIIGSFQLYLAGEIF